MTRVMAALALAALPMSAAASGTLVADLEQRLSTDGVDKLNTYLNSQGAWSLAALNRSTADCELQAVGLSIQLTRGSGSAATQAHREALRVAVGSCTGFVLALLSMREVPTFCASASSWTIMQMARELRRRIRRIDADELLRSSQRGKACRAAYQYELDNTRVGLRVGSPSAAPSSR